MSAVSANREPLVQLLLDYAADVHATNSSGQTALHYAVRSEPLLIALPLPVAAAQLSSRLNPRETCCT